MFNESDFSWYQKKVILFLYDLLIGGRRGQGRYILKVRMSLGTPLMSIKDSLISLGTPLMSLGTSLMSLATPLMSLATPLINLRIYLLLNVPYPMPLAI
ncbi:MAG: hypothetical protein PUP90_05270 [Nostoc sp. S4]|nr:hypothetical protein [Nostoc sp. S4]